VAVLIVRARTWVCVATWVLAMARAPSVHAQAHAPEYAVKAAYLYKFAPFVIWPASAFPSASSPFYVCVQGDDPFDGALDQAVSGQRVEGHPAVVRRLKSIDGTTGCHILYLGGSRKQSAADAMRSIRGEPILTVTDQVQGVAGSVIKFVVKDSRVRFEIDVEAASANRVSISSKLLSLALAVRSGD